MQKGLHSNTSGSAGGTAALVETLGGLGQRVGCCLKKQKLARTSDCENLLLR